MSRRHREEVEGRPVRKEDRLAEHRAKRRAARQVLALEGEEAVLSDGPGHLHAHRSEKPGQPRSRRRRHWKQPFWKRRAVARQQKALAAREIPEEA